jgi:hypothetical protein
MYFNKDSIAMGKKSSKKKIKEQLMKNQKIEPAKPSRTSKYSRSFAWFLIGTIFGLYVVGWFLSIIPGPKVTATISGFRGTTLNTSGCIYYSLALNIDRPIEYTYLKIQFPGKINNFKVGFPQESQMLSGKTAMQVYEAGKDVNGSCTIVQAAINNSEDIQASAAGNMLSVHSSKLPAQTFIIGMVSTTEGESSVNPIPASIYTEGEYEYLKLGQTVRKPMKIVITGITNIK